MRMMSILLAAALAGAVSLHAHAEVAKRILRIDDQGQSLLQPSAWQAFGKGFTREGEVFVCDNGADATALRGVSQHIVLNQKSPQPIVACAWSKADNVGGSRDSDYSLYLDLLYADGDHLWGQVGIFDTGTHDWQRREVRIMPDKPVKSLSFHLLLRRHGGRAWFRDARLVQVTVPEGGAMFDGVPTINSAGKAGYLVRDVAADSDFVRFENGEALGLKLEATEKTGPRAACATRA